jgi:hypothetical protein
VPDKPAAVAAVAILVMGLGMIILYVGRLVYPVSLEMEQSHEVAR